MKLSIAKSVTPFIAATLVCASKEAGLLRATHERLLENQRPVIDCNLEYTVPAGDKVDMDFSTCCYDPDGDPMTFVIDDEYLPCGQLEVLEEGVFRFKAVGGTTSCGGGEVWKTKLLVSDGSLQDTAFLSVTVLGWPQFDSSCNGLDIDIGPGEVWQMDYSECCNDPDDDELTLSLTNPSAVCGTLYFDGGILTYAAPDGSDLACTEYTYVTKVVCQDDDALSVTTSLFIHVLAANDLPCGNNLCGEGKVEVCHIPPGNPGKKKTICIDSLSASDHLDHGDFCGPCE